MNRPSSDATEYVVGVDFDPEIIEGELDDRAILALYDHAIALDSAFAPASVTPISIALA